ncbi:MAG: nuclear transport factor 2 family protein [Sphingorhabdus sp.]
MNDHALQRLLDEAACTKILKRYGHAVDWLDSAGLEKLFWLDAEIDLGFFKGSGMEAPGFLITNARLSLRRCHITTNILIKVSGDTAQSESSAITHAISTNPQQGLDMHLFYGRYLDVFECRDGEWRMAARRYLLHSYSVQPYAEDPALSAVRKAEGFGLDHPQFCQF